MSVKYITHLVARHLGFPILNNLVYLTLNSTRTPLPAGEKASHWILEKRDAVVNNSRDILAFFEFICHVQSL